MDSEGIHRPLKGVGLREPSKRDPMLVWIFVIAAGVVVGGLVLANLPIIFGLLLALVGLGLAVVFWAYFGLKGTLVVLVGLPLACWLMNRGVDAHFEIRKERKENGKANRTPASSLAPPQEPNSDRMVLTVSDSAAGLPVAMDKWMLDTILAALVFYRDNQLAYGTLPGQLDAQDTTELISQITPAKGSV